MNDHRMTPERVETLADAHLRLSRELEKVRERAEEVAERILTEAIRKAELETGCRIERVVVNRFYPIGAARGDSLIRSVEVEVEE